MSLDTTWWERQEAATFLSFNWSHPSRAWARDHAAALALTYGGTLIEVGPGAGVDYARGFRDAVLDGVLCYTGYEPTRAFHVALQAAYHESSWVNASTDELPPRSAAVVYARAVLEHQATLSPALPHILRCATRAVVLDWYRPPAAVASCDWVDGVPCHTFARTEVDAVLAAHGATIIATHATEGNEVWIVEVAQ